MRIPTICVGPVRSHWVPIRISPFCCPTAGPAKVSAAARVMVARAVMFLIAFLPMFISPILIGLVRERPDPEIIADVAPQPVQPFWFDNQEEDDQATEHDEPQIGDRVQQIGLREEQPTEILEEP